MDRRGRRADACGAPGEIACARDVARVEPTEPRDSSRPAKAPVAFGMTRLFELRQELVGTSQMPKQHVGHPVLGGTPGGFEASKWIDLRDWLNYIER